MLVREIYTRTPSDINYEIDFETENEIEAILAQIRMILGTKPLDVLGSPYFGINLGKYLFAYNFKADEVKALLIAHFNEFMIYDHQRYNVSIDIKYGKEHNDTSDYALIDITVNQQKCMGIVVSQNI